MDYSNLHKTSCLDALRNNKGTAELKQYFQKLVVQNRYKASSIVNDENLCFGTLYILWPLIARYRPLLNLNTRNTTAIKIMKSIIDKKSSYLRHLDKKDNQAIHSTLTWMMGTGYTDDGLNSQYDEILDTAGLLLVKRYHDTSLVLPMIDIVFSRNRKGTYNHDIAWCVFETRNPQVLVLIANYLNSRNSKDIEFAQKLLWFVPAKYTNRNRGTIMDPNGVEYWIRENAPFIEYTGESFQQKHNPAPFSISFKDKYICKPVGASTRSESPYEKKLLDEFECLDNYTKEILSNHSFMLYRQNRDWWNRWMSLPVPEQVRIAKTASGGIMP